MLTSRLVLWYRISENGDGLADPFLRCGLLVGTHPEHAAICAGIRVCDGARVLCLQPDRVASGLYIGFLLYRGAVGIFAQPGQIRRGVPLCHCGNVHL